MGLDMYLKKKEYVSPFDFGKKYPDGEAKKMEVTVKTIYADGDAKKTKFSCEYPDFGFYCEMPFMYWRKRNAIHKWFVDNFADGEDDCRSMTVNGSQLLELVKLCEEVLADHSKAEVLLPTQDGFFFGPTEYDDWYFSGLEMTVKRLKDVKQDDMFVYEASW